MSESREPAPSRASTSARYSRTSGGLVGAMLVTVLAVLAFAAFRAITRDNEPTPVRAVDYAASVQSARADKQLLVMAPEQLPTGWEATSAAYISGTSPTWHLGILTDHGKYVGVEESRASITDLVQEHVDADAGRGKDVNIGGQTWETWTDAGGDYVVARSLRIGGKPVESWLVVGTAPETEIRDFAGTLKGGTLRFAG
jgi:hypothetical protein